MSKRVAQPEMNGAPQAVLDACVLANFTLCDTLLRLAEPPRLFEPRWSQEIIRETSRTLEPKLGWPPSLIARFEAELTAHFSEAWITGYEPLIAKMKNHWKDRHVLAAAVHAGAQIVLTSNLRDFKSTRADRRKVPRCIRTIMTDDLVGR